MIDLANITVRAGNGGRGAGSFIHVKGKRRGKADGGDGGHGGNVYFETSRDLNTLEPYRFNKDFKAENGVSGLSKLKNGAMGRDLVLKVPVGTEVGIFAGPVSSFLPTSARFKDKSATDIESASLRAVGNPSTTATCEEIVQIYDLVEDGQKVLVARGGEGGRGNAHLRDEYGRRPLSGEAGEEGEQVGLRLELKLIADVGLIGLPNAGKSTLLSILTNAKPQIAPYPFTTLEPNLGVADNFKFQISNFKLENATRRKIVMADIPGLIEGASSGKGLGHEFLRHVERTRILVHLIDAGLENKWDAYKKIRQELSAHSKELAKKKEIVAINKADMIDKVQAKIIEAEFVSHKKRVIFISAIEGTGIGDLMKEILKRVR